MKKISDFYDPQLPTLLMSIHPEYVNQILQGTKIIEYRKRFFKEKFQAFVYTTGPQGGIQLFLTCAPAIRDDAQVLAKIGQKIQHDDFNEIYDYFLPKNTGCILPILATTSMEKVALSKIRQILPSIAIPQSYLFLDAPDKLILLNFLLKQDAIKHQTNQWEHHFANIANIKKEPTDIRLF